MGEIEGAMSSLSIGVAGIMTVFIAPATYQLFINLITLNTLLVKFSIAIVKKLQLKGKILIPFAK